MKKLRIPTRPTTLGVLILALQPQLLHAEPVISPGEWKYTMKTKIEGLGIPLPAIPVKFSACIAHSDPVVQTPEMREAGCEIVDKEIEGDTVAYSARCVSGDSVTQTNFKNTYQADSMEGSFTQRSEHAGKVQSTATGTLIGKRVGDCQGK